MVQLAALAWPEVAERVAAGAFLAVPVGSTEQHGPHLPLSTDSDVAVHLATALAHRRGDVLVAPVITYGSSGEHEGFAGTISIGQQATRLLLIELVRSATLTFPRVLLVVGHGGNAVPVNAAVAQLREERRDVLAWAPQWPGDAHAGRTETAVVLALTPQAVRLSAAVPGATDALPLLLPALQAAGVRAVSANGVLGDPSGADAVHGRQLLGAALEDLATQVERWTGIAR